MLKMIVNTITQIRDKTTSATHDQRDLKGESETNSRLKMKTERE